MKRFAVVALAIALFSSLATDCSVAQSVGAGVVLGGGSCGTTTGAFSVGADILGVRTDFEQGAVNLRMWLSRSEFGTSELGATVDTQSRLKFWQPRDFSVGYQYLIIAIDVSGVEPRRLKDAKVRLMTETCCIPLPVRECGCMRVACIDLCKYPYGTYGIDIASFNDAKKNSLKLPIGSIGINRETQKVSGYVQFTIYDPTPALAEMWRYTPMPSDPSMKARIEEQYLLAKRSYAVEPTRMDLDHETLANTHNQLLQRESALNAAGQSLAPGTVSYRMNFRYSDGSDYNGPIVVYGDDEKGTYPAFNATGPFIVMGGGATAGVKGFAFEFPGTGASVPRQPYAVTNGTVINVTVPGVRR